MRRKILPGLAAGFLSVPLGLLVAYVFGVVTIVIQTQELFASLLAAVTVLPLMLLFVLFIPTLIISLLTGLFLGVVPNFTNRSLTLIGGVTGLVVAEVVLTLFLPLLVVANPGDFTFIVTRYYASAFYGLVLGLVSGRLFRWFATP